MKRTTARDTDPNPEPTTNEPAATTGLVEAFYATLRAPLGAVKCAECSNSFMLRQQRLQQRLQQKLEQDRRRR